MLKETESRKASVRNSGFKFDIGQLMDHLLPVEVVGEVCTVTDDQISFVEEKNIVRNAVPKRRNEFAAGRLAAHNAMNRFGLPPKPLLTDRDRAPLWPTGVVGSISHTRELAFAAVTSETYAHGIGVDVEDDLALPSDIVTRVCLPSELQYLGLWSAEIGFDAAKLLFSAKEAFYKSYYPRNKRVLDFLDVGITLRPVERAFEVALMSDRSLDLAVIRGRFGLALGHVFCTVVIHASYLAR
jgi:4'-phosphopantetheinyl transferase EntD